MLDLGHTCAGIYDSEPQYLANSVARQFNVPMFEDKEQMLSPGVDIVGCGGVYSEKIDVIELCEQHGKHVMVDKPAVTNKADLVRLENVIARGKIQVGMLLTERFRPAIATLKEQIRKGRLGELVSLSFRKPHRLKPATRPDWFFTYHHSGGIAVDLLVHDFDLLRWLADAEVKDVHGYMTKSMLPQYPEFYDAISVQVGMDNYVTASLYADWHYPESSWTWGDCRIYATGTKGTAELRLEGDPLIDSASELFLSVGNGKPYTREEPLLPTLPISEDFINRIEGHSSVLTHDDILAATRASLVTDANVAKIDRTPNLPLER